MGIRSSLLGMVEKSKESRVQESHVNKKMNDVNILRKQEAVAMQED